MDFKVQIIRKQVKNITLRVKSPTEITVTANNSVTDKYLHLFVTQKRPWIEKKIAEYQNRKNLNNQTSYENNSTINFLGKDYPLEVIKNSKNTLIFNKNSFILYVRDPLNFSLKERIVYEWYLEKAGSLFEEIINNFRPLVRSSINQVTIKRLKSRWGSCSSNKNISLNLELIKTPIAFVEYVILHEMAHLIHMNHSKRFYDYVEKRMPDWKKRKDLGKTFLL